MRPDTGPFLTLSPFRTPVPLPVQDPDGEPSVSVTVACSWLPYIRGALMALTMQDTFPRTSDADTLLAQQRAMSLIALFVECEAPIPPIACPYDFGSSDGGWTLVPSFPQGSYSPGVGWIGQDFGGHNRYAGYIQHLLTTPNTITHIQFVYDADNDGCGPNDAAIIWVDQGSGPFELHVEEVLAGTNVVAWDGSLSDVQTIQVSFNSGDCTNFIAITSAGYAGLSLSGCG